MTSYFKHPPRATLVLFSDWLNRHQRQEVSNRVTVQQGPSPVSVSYSSQEAPLGSPDRKLIRQRVGCVNDGLRSKPGRRGSGGGGGGYQTQQCVKLPEQIDKALVGLRYGPKLSVRPRRFRQPLAKHASLSQAIYRGDLCGTVRYTLPL